MTVGILLRFVTTTTGADSPQLVYQVKLNLSTQTWQLVTATITAHRASIKSR